MLAGMAPPELVFIDTETTGLDPARDRIIDLAAVRVDRRLEVVERRSLLLDPGRPLPLVVTRLTGICDADVAGQPSFAEAWSGFLGLLDGATVVGHNVGFDTGFLTEEARRAGLAPPAAPVFDTLDAALLLFPELDHHNLRALAAVLDAGTPTHRALADAQVTLALFAALCRRAASLTPPERRLLQAAGWAPLELLDRFPLAPGGEDAGGHRRRGPAAARRRGARGAARPRLRARRLAARAGRRRRPRGPPRRLPHAPGAGRPRRTRRDPARRRRGRPLRGRHGHGQEPRLPAAGGVPQRARPARRVAVSTKTKVLQRQLASHDLPLVAAALPGGWRWSLLMGRENYVCRRRLDEAVADAAAGLPDRERLLGSRLDPRPRPPRRGRPVGAAVPRLDRAPRARAARARAALDRGCLPRPSLRALGELPLAPGPAASRARAPRLREPRAAADRPQRPARVRRRRDRRGAPAAGRGDVGVLGEGRRQGDRAARRRPRRRSRASGRSRRACEPPPGAPRRSTRPRSWRRPTRSTRRRPTCRRGCESSARASRSWRRWPPGRAPTPTPPPATRGPCASRRACASSRRGTPRPRRARCWPRAWPRSPPPRPRLPTRCPKSIATGPAWPRWPTTRGRAAALLSELPEGADADHVVWVELEPAGAAAAGRAA